MKGQSATEQMITYGWAGMILVVVVGVKLYFGVFNMFNSVPEKCVFQNGLLCKSSRLYSDSGQLTVNFEATNKFSKKIRVTGVQCSAESADPATGYPARGLVDVSIDVNPEFSFSQTLTCYSRDGTSTADAFDNFEGLVYVRYQELDSGFGSFTISHMRVGNIGGRVYR